MNINEYSYSLLCIYFNYYNSYAFIYILKLLIPNTFVLLLFYVLETSFMGSIQNEHFGQDINLKVLSEELYIGIPKPPLITLFHK